MQRHSSDKGEEGYCGTDYDPKQGRSCGMSNESRLLILSDSRSVDFVPGVGCQGGPATLPVCGMCGILSDSVYPEGVSSM